MNIPIENNQKRFLPIVAAISFFMAALDSTAVNTIIPYLSNFFNTPLFKTKNIIIYYMVAGSLFIPLTGYLCQKHGCRIIFCLSLAIFTSGSLLCGLSHNLNELLIARIIQGSGGALMLPIGRLAIIQTFSKDELVKALSMVTLPALTGPLIGPIVGGIITSYFHWSLIFLINIPFGILGIIFALRIFPDIMDKSIKMDYTGYGIFAISIAFLTYALSLFSETKQFKIPTLILILGILLMIFYWIKSYNHKHPLFHHNLFKVRSFTIGIFGNIVARIGCGAVPFMLPLMLQILLGLSPVKCGFAMLPLAIASFVGKSFVDQIIRQTGYRRFLFINTILLSFSYISYVTVTSSSSWTLLVVLMLITGFINSIQFTAMNTVTVIDLSFRKQPSGSGLLSTVMQLSMASGVAVSAILLNVDQSLHPNSAPAMHFHFTWFWLGITTLFSSFIFWFLPKGK
ncbi:MFS transporter [Commensalibacter melissae]|uniref:MFS transporter n=1 Tax=Commensalibacter melissae TaxID=2070537 RepID=UPI0012D91412|nr:MFS transporter [Commensalibacter melissae]MUH04628.1 MFS transporter [Commensalibacter melissae]